MNAETLSKANELNEQIKKIENLTTYLKNERETHSSKVYRIEHYSQYSDIMETAQIAAIAIVIDHAENELLQLTKELEAL